MNQGPSGPRTEFVDELPPPQTRARESANRKLAARLRANPGRWARYPWPVKYPHGTKHRIRTGMAAAFGSGFEAETRYGVVYVRYVGVKR